MVNCNECDERISEVAMICPKCGSKQFHGFRPAVIFLALLNGGFTWFVITWICLLTNKSFIYKYDTLIDCIGIGVGLYYLHKWYNTRIPKK